MYKEVRPHHRESNLMSTPHAPIGRPFGPTPRQRDVLARPFAALRLDPAIIFAALIAPSAYLSPDWYATERLPPTWNYVTVQARGQISRLAPQDLRQLLDDLSAANE
jgi:transcriptional regulator